MRVYIYILLLGARGVFSEHQPAKNSCIEELFWLSVSGFATACERQVALGSYKEASDKSG